MSQKRALQATIAIALFAVLYFTGWLWPLVRLVVSAVTVASLGCLGYYGFSYYQTIASDEKIFDERCVSRLCAAAVTTLSSFLLLILIPNPSSNVERSAENLVARDTASISNKGRNNGLTERPVKPAAPPENEIESFPEQNNSEYSGNSAEEVQPPVVTTGINDDNFRRIRDGLFGTRDKLRDVEKLFGTRGKSLAVLNGLQGSLDRFYWENDSRRYVVTINSRNEIIAKTSIDLSEQY